jgi:antitoxin YokJ
LFPRPRQGDIGLNAIDELVRRIANTPGCRVLPASGLPVIADGLLLPDDVKAFYTACGGCVFFESADYAIDVPPPNRFRPANPEIRGGNLPGDISEAWYIAAESGGTEYLTIDLHPARLGRCYDSFWDRHAIPGTSDIIAASFTELLTRLLENGGQYWFWLQPGFNASGDAYDDIQP